MNIKFLGHSAVLLETDVIILIDPFISNNPLCRNTPEEFFPDIIILTHGHSDHIGDTIEIAQRTACTVYAMAELANWISEKGVKTHGFNIGCELNISTTSIYVTQAIHSASCPDGSYGGLACGFVIRYNEKTFYHSGDTALFSDMKLIGKKFRIDVAMLPIGNNYTMGITDAVKAVEYLSPVTVIPMHYNTFPLICCNPGDFKISVENLGYKCNILQPGMNLLLK